MNTHPNHTAVVDAIKALPAYTDPQTYIESELAECYSDEELVATFGWNLDTEEPLTVEQALQEVKELCDLRQDVHGWIVEEGEAERKSAMEANARDREEEARQARVYANQGVLSEWDYEGNQ